MHDWRTQHMAWEKNKPMTPEQIAESCEIAAAILEGHWTRGLWYSPHEEEGVEVFCLEGGLAAALGIDVTQLSAGTWERATLFTCPVYEAVADTVAETLHGYALAAGELADWNDHQDRTEQEVLDILHATAKRVLGVGPDKMRSNP